MLTTVEVTSSNGSVLRLPLQDVTDGFLVEKVEGLEPVIATLVSSTFAQIDGSRHHHERRENRNIIVYLSMEPDWGTESVAQLRQRLYNIFMTKTQVTLGFYMDEVLFATATGRVESFVAPLFAQQPKATIGIICNDPDFIAPLPEVFDGITTEGTQMYTLPYEGTTPTGVIVTVNANRDCSSLTFATQDSEGLYQTLTTTEPLMAGDILTISTIPGDKYVRLTRGGSTSSAMNSVNPKSEWFLLTPGVNQLRLTAAGVGDIPYSIAYTPRYGGL